MQPHLQSRKMRKVLLTKPVRENEQLPLSVRVADTLTAWMGTFSFILGQGVLLLLWIVFNSLLLLRAVHFDPYPYILLNLFMSAEATFAAPLIMISQNRQELKARAMAQHTFEDAEAMLASVNALQEKLETIHQLLLQTCGDGDTLLTLPQSIERVERRLEGQASSIMALHATLRKNEEKLALLITLWRGTA